MRKLCLLLPTVILLGMLLAGCAVGMQCVKGHDVVEAIKYIPDKVHFVCDEYTPLR